MKRNIRKLLDEDVGFPIVDHSYHKKEAEKIYLYPYPCGKERYQQLINFCNEHNLDFTIGADHTYNPTGSTVEIKIFDEKS